MPFVAYVDILGRRNFPSLVFFVLAPSAEYALSFLLYIGSGLAAIDRLKNFS